MGETKRSSTRVKGFHDAEMDFQLIRQLGSAYYGGASVGECFALAESMPEESPQAWVTAFKAKAQHLENDAKARQDRKHHISAREQYLKACNSYRAAEYYLDINDETHKLMGLKSRECFINAMGLSSCYFEEGFVSYNSLSLPYYFIVPDKNKLKRKTIVIVSGFDGTLEESYIQAGIAALARDYNVVLFAGPGQMDSLRFNETHFEPDFEKPIASLLDAIIDKEQIDSHKIALYGISFGGYFTSRAACYESRIQALVANSPIIDLHGYMAGFVGFDPSRMSDAEDFKIEDLPHFSDEDFPPSYKELARSLIQRFGGKSFKQTFQYLEEFAIKDTMDRIKCSCFAMIGEGEGSEPRQQFDLFCKGVAKVQNYAFSSYEGADAHCQVGNLNFSNCILYDWLDEVFQ